MKLIYRIARRVSLAVGFLFTLWAVFFYVAIIDEINDEVDDTLEDYSELIIIRALAGEDLPSLDNGSNNQYFIQEVTPEYATQNSKIAYLDEMVYIKEKSETEPARILITIFKDNNGQFYELTVSTPTIEKKDLAESILSWVVTLFLMLLLTLYITNLVVLRKSFKPLYSLLHWLDNYRIGKKNEPLKNDTQTTEFKKLNEAIIHNAARNEEMYEQQMQFIGNASHELQTPIAICRTRIEMMMEDDTLAEKQLTDLGSVYHTLEQITKMNRSLLLLLKIDNGQFNDDSEIEINTLVEKYLNDFAEVYQHKNIHIDLLSNQVCRISMNDMLAGILISNLLKNSFIHNVDNGAVTVTINKNELIISNTGEGKRLDEKHIFDRFYQKNNRKDSSGLGLAIVNTICKQYHIAINYRFEEDKHIFCINFSK